MVSNMKITLLIFSIFVFPNENITISLLKKRQFFDEPSGFFKIYLPIALKLCTLLIIKYFFIRFFRLNNMM